MCMADLRGMANAQRSRRGLIAFLGDDTHTPSRIDQLLYERGARLRGFPDQFRFLGTRHDIRYQIGNAIPPPLARAAGRRSSARLQCSRIPSSQTFSFQKGITANSR